MFHVAAPPASAVVLHSPHVLKFGAAAVNVTECEAPAEPRLQMTWAVAPAETEVRSSEIEAVVGFHAQESLMQLRPAGQVVHGGGMLSSGLRVLPAPVGDLALHPTSPQISPATIRA